MKPSIPRVLVLWALLLAGAPQAVAGVVINGTRVVYPAKAREVTVQVDNVGDAPSLVQAWVDGGDAEQTAEQADAPFMLTPPISRVEPGRSQALRLVFTGASLPSDRESLFWLNVLDVPPSPKTAADEQNYLQVAFRSRIKLFYRPDGLAGQANDAPAALQWRRDGKQLRVDNPTPYHVTIAEVHLLVAGAEQAIEQQGKMVGPGQQLLFAMPEPTQRLRFVTINDYGGRIEHVVSLDAGD